MAISSTSFDRCITSVTPTVCRLMGISPPALVGEEPLADVIRVARLKGNDAPLKRCLIYAPDAIGAHLWSNPDLDFAPVLEHAPVKVAVRSVVPPKTPVCFASMFTGALPPVHGIRKYERPVLQCPTLFDALIAAGKRVAIVAVADSSVDLIFRGREIDYHSELYDKEVLQRAIELLAADVHDVVVAYQQEYDDTLHRTRPLSPECLQAARNHIASFAALAAAARKSWHGRPWAAVFAPDHGAHFDPLTGHGDHGEDIPDDMHLFHCYGVFGK